MKALIDLTTLLLQIRIVFEGTNGFFEQYKDVFAFVLGLFTFLITLATLVITSIFNYKSAKAAERSADAAERAAKSSEESAKFSEQSTKSAAKSAESSAESVKVAESATEISAQTLQVQREHNIKSVTPILLVESINHDEEVSVKLTNNGIGPLINKSVLVTNGAETRYNIIEWMPAHPKGITYWQTYKTGHNGLSIPPDKSVYSILLANQDENFPDYVLFRAFVRRNLSKLRMIVEAEDIYNRPLTSQNISLNWFGILGAKWFQNNFSSDFDNNFNLTLQTAKVICSPTEWDKKVEKIKNLYIPNKITEENKPKIIIK